MKRALLLLLLIILALTSSVLTRLNHETVSFNYYFASIDLSLAMLLIVVFICGAMMGLLMTLGLSISAHSQKRRLQRTLQLRELEIRNLRDIPIKGKH